MNIQEEVPPTIILNSLDNSSSSSKLLIQIIFLRIHSYSWGSLENSDQSKRDPFKGIRTPNYLLQDLAQGICKEVPPTAPCQIIE